MWYVITDAEGDVVEVVSSRIDPDLLIGWGGVLYQLEYEGAIPPFTIWSTEKTHIVEDFTGPIKPYNDQ